MGAMTQESLAAGRVGLKKYYAVEASKVPAEWKDIIGRVDATKQTFEIYKQYAGFGPATQTDEGKRADFENLNPLYLLNLRPVLFTKGAQFSLQTKYTDQYGLFAKLTPQIAKSFVERRNLNVADLFNSGFTNTTYGMNSETLFASGHAMGSVYFANRPLAAGQVPSTTATTLDIGLSPLGYEQAWKDLQKQVSAKNLPLYPQSKILSIVPPELYLPACRAISASFLAGTNNNDPNVIRDKYLEPVQNHYLTSATAWFMRASNNEEHGLVFLEQLAYDTKELPMMDDMLYKRVAFESWTFGWYDAHGTWGTQGQ